VAGARGARQAKPGGIDVNIINAGVEGYDTLGATVWRADADPPGVLLGFVANDVYTNRPVPPPPMLRPRRGRIRAPDGGAGKAARHAE
jgi:hypothetical protein